MKFISSLIIALCKAIESMPLTLSLASVLISLVLYSATRYDGYNIIISGTIQAVFKKKGLKDRSSRSKELARQGYRSITPIIAALLKFLICTLITLSFKGNDYSDVNTMFGNIDLAQSIKNIYLSRGNEYNFAFLFVITPLLAEVLYDMTVLKNTYVDTKVFSYSMIAIVAMGLVFLPSAFCILWMVIKVFDLLILVFITRVNYQRSLAHIQTRAAQSRSIYTGDDSSVNRKRI